MLGWVADLLVAPRARCLEVVEVRYDLPADLDAALVVRMRGVHLAALVGRVGWIGRDLELAQAAVASEYVASLLALGS